VRTSCVPASGTVARRVEIEFVGDRLASARLAQAYSVLAPERQPVRSNERSDDEREDGVAGERAAGQDRGDLRSGVLRAPASRADDPESDSASGKFGSPMIVSTSRPVTSVAIAT
jgi:hypothetical protein